MAFDPLFLKSASLTIDNEEVADEVSNVTLTPTSSAITFKGISGLTSQSQGTEAWAASITYAQDWTNAASLSRKLFDGAGDTVTLVFKPTGAAVGQPTITVTATLVAGAIGGAVDAVSEATVVLPVTGRPALSPAA